MMLPPRTGGEPQVTRPGRSLPCSGLTGPMEKGASGATDREPSQPAVAGETCTWWRSGSVRLPRGIAGDFRAGEPGLLCAQTVGLLAGEWTRELRNTRHGRGPTERPLISGTRGGRARPFCQSLAPQSPRRSNQLTRSHCGAHVGPHFSWAQPSRVPAPGPGADATTSFCP
ncbi:hypothetical protein NDU88_003851 [Pleurodeles waltl]|uniref:Uncharacterized protein n=1 Tax=Pleurodeles waltl TaxID=8319 RepID=A0AAV7UDB4_PLEWA|nr:hypothetical protein NDU88_003851 [Pleurodeles waltl]